MGIVKVSNLTSTKVGGDRDCRLLSIVAAFFAPEILAWVLTPGDCQDDTISSQLVCAECILNNPFCYGTHTLLYVATWTFRLASSINLKLRRGLRRVVL